jgi:hypothetical protein
MRMAAIVGTRHLSDAPTAAALLATVDHQNPTETIMKAWLCENAIGPEALEWKDLLTLNRKQVKCTSRSKAASRNFPDLLIVQNKYQAKPPRKLSPAWAGTRQAGACERLRRGSRALPDPAGSALQRCTDGRRLDDCGIHRAHRVR